MSQDEIDAAVKSHIDQLKPSFQAQPAPDQPLPSAGPSAPAQQAQRIAARLTGPQETVVPIPQSLAEQSAGLPSLIKPPTLSEFQDRAAKNEELLYGNVFGNIDIPTGATPQDELILAPARAAAGAANYVLSPGGALETLLAATPAAPVIFAKWAKDMLSSGVRSIADVKDAMASLIGNYITSRSAEQVQGSTKTPQVDPEAVRRLADDVVNGVVGITGGTTIGAHGITKGIDYASKITPSAKVYGDVRSQPLESSGQMPTEVSGEGVQPQTKTVAETTQIPLEEPAKQPATSLPPSPESAPEPNVAPTEAIPETTQEPASPSVTTPVTQSIPAFAAKYDPNTLMQRPEWVEPGSKLDNVLGELRAKNDPLIGVDIAPIWKTLTPTQRQDLASRGWVVTSDRNPNAVVLKLAQDVVPARNFYGMQQRIANRASQPSPEPPKEVATPSSSLVDTGATAPKGIAASVRNKWTSATEPTFGSEAGFFSLAPIHNVWKTLSPALRKTADEVMAVGKEALKAGKVDDYRRAVLGWSGKLQKSFGEASDAKKEITSMVPNRIRREGITNWIQANGDKSVLAARAAASKPEFKAGYEAALNLSPEELKVASDVKATFDTLHGRGSAYDVLNGFVDNYVPQIWNLRKGPEYGGTRTLRDKFRHSKARTFDTFFDGEQAGFVPKTKDISELLPMYMHEMNYVIASRQLVQDLNKGVASDGRPLTIPKGSGTQVTDSTGKSATLVMPKTIPKDTADYKVIPNQPALHEWKWASTDEAGNPVLLKADLALHPEAYNKLKNVLGTSKLREWYSTRTTAIAQIPKLLVHGLDLANSETKKTMLGLLAPFHQVQEGTHAVGHRINPFFNIPKIDLVKDAGQADAAKHGLMLLPDRASANQFMEGFRVSGLVSRIPGVGPLADFYSNYLFHEYIPGLKYKTYQAILERNNKVYAKELASGEYKPEDIKALSSEQTNAAFGHLNYSDLGRSPTVQHFLRLGLLAPDFLEARGRFALQAIKGTTGSKVGREQLVALGALALSQAALAYTSAKLTDGDWDWKKPFEFHKGDRTYTLRSVPEDTFRLITDARAFVHNRLSPIVGKGAVQLATGTDWRGQKVTTGQTLKELAMQPIPLTLRGLFGVGNSPLSGWEQLAGSAGLKISRYSAVTDVMKMASNFKKNSTDPKIQAQLAQSEKTVHPTTVTKSLRDALHKNDLGDFEKAYKQLLSEGKTDKDIDKLMRPNGSDFRPKPFTGSYKTERLFVDSLTEPQRKIYEKAVEERRDLYSKFQNMRSRMNNK